MIPRKIEASTTLVQKVLSYPPFVVIPRKSRLLQPPEYQQVANKQPVTQIITDCQSAR